MDNAIHALIRGFLQQQTIISLAEPFSGSPESYTKAGVIPFLRAESLRYYFMKPHGSLPELGAPPFQLCKGTRQHLLPGKGWWDMKESASGALDKESLAETALREGIEELGLELANIRQLFDLGGFAFSSATTGKSKQMWLFAAEIREERDFLPDRDIAETTEARKWLSASEFAVAGRADHRYIVEAIEVRLCRHFKE